MAHFGDMGLARDLLNLTAEAGADAFKIQLFDVEQLIAAQEIEWRERLRPRNLTLGEAEELKARCDDSGLLFLATAHDESRIEWLEHLGVAAVKVGSGERNNPAFLSTLATLGRFLDVPAEALTREFEADATAEEICARTIRTLLDLDARHFYVSNLPVGRAAQTLSAIMKRVAPGASGAMSSPDF